MPNTTSNQTSNHITIPPILRIVLNDGFTHLSGPSKCLPSAELACARDILKYEAQQINMPFGQIEFQSRRRGSFLEFALGKGNVVFCSSAVSSHGLNREFWDELMARRFGMSHAKTLKAPKHGPWIAATMCPGVVHLKNDADMVQVLLLAHHIEVAFILYAATSPMPIKVPFIGEARVASSN